VLPLRAVTLAFAAGLLQAQAPPAAPVPQAETAPPPVVKPLYHYAGKPIALEGKCGDAEMADYGMSCTPDEPCPVYLELSAVEAAGSKLYLSGDFHTESATLWSVLLASDDDGQSWTEPFDRLRGVALEQMQFPGFATGFAAGHTAGALPKDPFLLRTVDSGKTWSRLPLFEAGAVGLIEYFHFDSATHGTLGVDRVRPGAGHYMTLETETGGDAWTVRQSSADQPPRPARDPNPLARVRADDGSKSFRVERRENGVWRTAAAFAIAAGACHGDPPAPVPAPAPAGAPALPPAQPR